MKQQTAQQKLKYHAKIRELSDRIVAAQTPIRILDAIKWPESVAKEFFSNKCEKLPNITQEYYTQNPLRFDPSLKKQEFKEILQDLNKYFGSDNNAGHLMKKMCREYLQVIDLLEARGTPKFSAISKTLYGSANDKLYKNQPSLKDLADLVTNTLQYIKKNEINEHDIKKYSAADACEILHERLESYFVYDKNKVKIKISDNIVSDAAAGAEYIKISSKAKFSERDLRILEVHEGWVHIATTINGKRQPYCTFLSKGCPSATISQEGLAIIMEVFNFVSHPERMLGIGDRIHAIEMAESGANFIEVYKFYINQGFGQVESYSRAQRVFRGSLPSLGPFTKDIAYNKGFIFIYNFIRIACKLGTLGKIPLLFVGKIDLKDIHILHELLEEKVIMPPIYVPPQFRDLAALSSWMCYSLFLNQLNLNKIAEEYKYIFT